jgi:hypothetical protein
MRNRLLPALLAGLLALALTACPEDDPGVDDPLIDEPAPDEPIDDFDDDFEDDLDADLDE